jgi:hypothetical protein
VGYQPPPPPPTPPPLIPSSSPPRSASSFVSQPFQSQPPPIQTTADIKRLQEMGVLRIESDENQGRLKLEIQVSPSVEFFLDLNHVLRTTILYN